MNLPGAYLRCLACLVGLLVLPGMARSGGFERDALKHVVSACALTKRTVGVSFPCLDVKTGKPGAEDYAVIRAPQFRTEVLVVPVDAIAGIEDPALLTTSSAHLWEAAWAARHFVADALGRDLPRNAVGLAVNSVAARSQDQFHIHVDCLDGAVQRAVIAGKARIGDTWRRFPLPLGGAGYWARSIASADLKGVNVAALLFKGLPAGRGTMDRMSVAVVGMTMRDGRDGFLLLAHDGSRTAEALLDHSCRAF
ncbi:CDP-diacylglycerol diphosphatase [Labrys monachus]|uniref:CDP-diacylglycerol pyrophosphatase n=1 Tax=Labrys monachus TaxID=217067 RepID=A0ABU0FGE0_9HYPH|nr:CDP-diacylglycerol diphosphatase [Labrys monachus]MDQ0393120.1 CDP-diacylglycerol pyrophosphatase [Labrys monachus]